MIEKGVIRKVTEDDTHFSIDIEGSWSFCLSKEYGAIPKVWDAITLHTKNVSTVRGVDLNGVRVFYKTDAELDLEHEQWCANYEKKKLATFEKNRAQMDSDYESLPENFKKRIDRFRKNNPKFRVDFEGYELFCCKEALKIADVCKTPDEIKRFHAMGWGEQHFKIPSLSDGHSGNTFGCACMLARLQTECPERVYEMHGSLSPLVGSKDFGDMAVEEWPIHNMKGEGK